MRGWRLGSLGGIDIEINYTWLLLLALLTSSLAFSLKTEHPGSPEFWYWVAGVVTSLLFLGSVLAHEMCHSLVARRLGMGVRRITLFIFGGVSQIEEEPRTARVELLMTVVGPGSSAVLGLVFWGLGFLAERPGPLQMPDLVTASLHWLGLINLFLAGFNLVPGFPLDGGRLLRSLLWSLWNDEYRATRVATAMGSGLGGIMMAWGVLDLFLGYAGNGVWVLILEWIILSAARQSAAQNEYKFMLSGLQAGQVMQWPVLAVPASMPLAEALHSLTPTGVQPLYPVVDAAGKAAGVLDQRSLTRVTPAEWGTVTVNQVMSPLAEALTIDAHEPVSDALTRLVQGGQGWLLVISPEGRPVGLVTEQSIMAAAGRRARERESTP